jgi:hypothetical protein
MDDRDVIAGIERGLIDPPEGSDAEDEQDAEDREEAAERAAERRAEEDEDDRLQGYQGGEWD